MQLDLVKPYLSYRLSSCTHTGNVRENNEDSVGHQQLDDGSVIAIVADGMGGHVAGEVASRTAVETVLQRFLDPMHQDIQKELSHALMDANEAIIAENLSLSEQGVLARRRGMGTTAVVTYLTGKKAYFAHVGDSRIYLVRDGELLWRTKDHTPVQALVDAGQITKEQAREHPEGNILNRALGHMQPGKPLLVDVAPHPFELQPGDQILMSSDGLHDLLSDEEIVRVISALPPATATDQLTKLALGRGGHDNITIFLIRYEEKTLTLKREEPKVIEPPPPAPQIHHGPASAMVMWGTEDVNDPSDEWMQDDDAFAPSAKKKGGLKSFFGLSAILAFLSIAGGSLGT